MDKKLLKTMEFKLKKFKKFGHDTIPLTEFSLDTLKEVPTGSTEYIIYNKHNPMRLCESVSEGHWDELQAEKFAMTETVKEHYNRRGRA
jgi:hypothetical protein